MMHLKKAAAVIVVLLLAGCANKTPQKIYQWGDYQKSVYQYYTNETTPQDQIAALRTLIETAQASNKPVPPGVHAHLGMLYSNTGDAGLAMAEFNAEKNQYPESAAYMNFLTTKKEGSVK